MIYACASGVVASFTRSTKLVLGAYLLVNVVITAAFFAERMFFAKRYLIAMGLILLIRSFAKLSVSICTASVARVETHYQRRSGTNRDYGHQRIRHPHSRVK